MSPLDKDDERVSVVVPIIRELTNDVHEFKDSIIKRVDESDKNIEARIVQLRMDFNRALQPFLLDMIDRDKNIAKDALDREKRQVQIDKQFFELRFILFGVIMLVGSLMIVLLWLRV